MTVTNDYLPALIGTTATFDCPSGQRLTGPNATTCMENGHWEPDTSEVKCVGELNERLSQCLLETNNTHTHIQTNNYD